jgi:release factor glutamine methyltransferase
VNHKQALTLAAEKLAALKDIDAPTFEAEILLRYSLNISRTALHLKLNQKVPDEQCAHFWNWVERRLQGEPTSYIIRRREFYGLDFEVDKRVLIPRPETELLVETALKLAQTEVVRSIADIGTGSGAIAISLAVNWQNSSLRTSRTPEAIRSKVTIYATDISPQALEVARANAQKQSVANHITFLQGDLLEELPQPVDIIIANLPYVSTAEVKKMPSAQYEPVLALDGGEAGLDQIYRLAGQLKGKINQGGWVLLEVGMGQFKAVSKYLSRLYPEALIEVLPDLAGIERVVKMKLQIRNHE